MWVMQHSIFTISAMLTAITTILQLSKVMNVNDDELSTAVDGETRLVWPLSDTAQLNQLWETFTEEYGVPIAQYCISVLYTIYLHLTLINVAVFLLKCVPTAIYMYKFLKDVYCTSRDRIRQKQIVMEDIQLQIQIVNTKLCVRDSEFTERAEQLRRIAKRLRRVRSRVRDVIAADETLRRTLDAASDWDADHELHVQDITQEEDCEFIVELIKELKYDQVAVPERPLPPEKMDCGEHAQNDSSSAENSVYSSLSDTDARQDCRVKIVKVTNVYKVAYLKHYIKQKRLRRANKQALLKKKMESIKKLLDDWRKTLNMVINSKLTILNIDPHPMDVVSQDAMGDYSKPHEYADSDSDLRNSVSDMCYDEYSLSWSQNPYRPYSYNYEDVPETAVSREYYDSQDYGDLKYSFNSVQQCMRTGVGGNITSIVEETISQIAIEETQTDPGDDYEYQDLISL